MQIIIIIINTNGNVDTWVYHHHLHSEHFFTKQLTDYSLDIVRGLENKDFNTIKIVCYVSSTQVIII